MRTVAAVIDQGALTFDFAIPCEIFGLDRSDNSSSVREPTPEYAQRAASLAGGLRRPLNHIEPLVPGRVFAGGALGRDRERK